MAQVNVNRDELTIKVKEMYKQVAENPKGKFHFEMGKVLAEKLGYSLEELDKVPQESIASFAGVGYYFDLADIKEGEKVLDLGSGSGMDSFIAAQKVGEKGKVIGIDMTKEQLKKSNDLKEKLGLKNIEFVEGYIEFLPFPDESFDVVISNGVINLSVDKAKVFNEISRVLKNEGRIAISDILTEKQLTNNIVCDVKLWASCIGGATQEDSYRSMIQNAGMKIITFKEHPEYQFLSKSAQGATKDFGVKSVSILATKGK